MKFLTNAVNTLVVFVIMLGTAGAMLCVIFSRMLGMIAYRAVILSRRLVKMIGNRIRR